MGYLILKAVLTGLIVVAIAEISKRSSVVAAVLASLPLTSILAFIWMYVDDKNIFVIRELSYGIFWMVLPSLAFFLLFPLFLKMEIRFYPALVLACLSTGAIYGIYIKVLNTFGMQL